MENLYEAKENFNFKMCASKMVSVRSLYELCARVHAHSLEGTLVLTVQELHGTFLIHYIKFVIFQISRQFDSFYTKIF